MKPHGIKRAGNDKLCQACCESAQGSNLCPVKNQAEQKTENRVADGKAREKGACLGAAKKLMTSPVSPAAIPITGPPQAAAAARARKAKRNSRNSVILMLKKERAT